MTGENALKAQARELLAAEVGVPVKSGSDMDLGDYHQVFVADALRAIVKALTRSGCEDRAENFGDVRGVLRSLRPTHERNKADHRLNAAISTVLAALAKALPSLPGEG